MTIVNPDRRARLAAVYGIIAFVSVVYTTIVIRVRTDTLHPVVIGPSVDNPAAEGGFAVRTDLHIGVTLGIGSIAWMITACTLVWYRLRLENLSERIQLLKMRVLSQ